MKIKITNQNYERSNRLPRHAPRDRPRKKAKAMTHYIKHDGQDWRVPENHYSESEVEALFFYGGPFSNFVGGPYIISMVQPFSSLIPAPAFNFRYRSVEHFFAASKAVTLSAHLEIANAKSPWQAKAAGRKTELREDWEEVKFDVMLTGLRVKFSDHKMRAHLLATRDRLICEDSPTDYVWGIQDGTAHGYTGTNLLGKALMQVRAEIQAQLQTDGSWRVLSAMSLRPSSLRSWPV